MVDLLKPGSRRLQNCHVDHISSDSCGIAVVRVGGLGDRSENMHISHIKGESFIAGKQSCIIHLDSVQNVRVRIHEVSGAVGGVSIPHMDAIVKITTAWAGGRVELNGYIPNIPYAVHKYVGGVATIPMSALERGQTLVYPSEAYAVEV
jgi:hypothetical protein